jgi:hypothetical protein
MIAAVVNAAALSLLVRRVALQVPAVSDAAGTALSSVVVLVVVWALKEEAATNRAPAKVLETVLLARAHFWLPVLAALTVFAPVMTLRCEEDGTVLVAHAGEASQDELICRASTTQPISFVGWTPEVTAVDGADRREAHRTLRPFSPNELSFPGDFANPLQVLVTLDQVSTASLAPGGGHPVVLRGGCDVRESLFCVDVEGIGPYPLGRRPLLIGGTVAAPSLLAKWHEDLQASHDWSPDPYAIARSQKVRPGHLLHAKMMKYDAATKRFRSCTGTELTPLRGDGNLWEIEAERLCSQG